ncbi:MAG: hypothetical protein ABSD62_08470 [Candidatus Limnocylindrales bacterium]
MSRLVWAAGIGGFFAFSLAAGSVLPPPLLALVVLVALVLCGPALGLMPAMHPRRYAPDTRMGRAKLYAAFLVAGLLGAILGAVLPLGFTLWLPFGLIGVALLAFTFKVGSTPRPHQDE